MLFQVVEGVYMYVFSKNHKTYQYQMSAQYFTDFTSDC